MCLNVQIIFWAAVSVVHLRNKLQEAMHYNDFSKECYSQHKADLKSKAL